MSIMPPASESNNTSPHGWCDDFCMAPFGSHHERCVMPTDHDGGRVGCNHSGGICSELPSQLGSR